MAAIVVVTAWWAIQLLDRSPTWNTWLHPLIFVAAALGAVLLLLLPLLRTVGRAAGGGRRARGHAGRALHRQRGHGGHARTQGPIPTAAPAVDARGGALRCGRWVRAPRRSTATAPEGGAGRTAVVRPVARAARTGGPGGLLDASAPSAAAGGPLEDNADQYTWVAATIGANEAAGYQLATDDAGDGDRRLQRHRPVAHAGPVRGAGAGGADPLVHRRRVRGLRRVRWPAARSRRGWSSTTSR